jgi:DNA helicase HerA-like ATPase
MSNGLQIPVYLDISYLVGPDTTHVNASGISGNAKTSYLLFLLQSVYQKLKEYHEEFALVIFNTKEADLLHIHGRGDEENKKKNEEIFDILNLQLDPFENITYFLPRGKDGKPNSIHIPENAKTYSYELVDVYDRLELLFSEIYDPHYNLSSIVNYIYEFWPIEKNKNANAISEERKGNEENVVKTWTDLFNFKDYPGEIVTHKSSLLQFQGYVQRFRRSSLFIDKKVTSTYLGKEIKQIRSGDVFVIDIAMLSELEQQAFVIGDVMKSIDEMYSLRAETANLDDGSSSSKRSKNPKYLLIFIDEINRFLPKSRQAGRMNTVAEQIMKTLVTGRSRGTILFSAQQFKSTVDYALHENTGMHITAKVGLSELSTAPYNIIDESTKMNIVRLNKGELVLIHSAFRHPIKITFPKAPFKKP